MMLSASHQFSLFLGGLDSILGLAPLIRPLTSVTGFKALSGWCLGVTGGHGDLKLPALNVSTCFRSYVCEFGCVRTKSVGDQ